MSPKQQVINFMASERVFRSGSIVDAHPSISKRSIDYYIKELVEEGRIAPVHKGLYFIQHPDKPVSRSEIGRALSPSSVVSLDTAFLSDRSDRHHVFHMVADSGRIGSFDSPIGPIAIHGVPRKLLSELTKSPDRSTMFDGFDGFGGVQVVSKELASLHISYLNNERKRGQTYGHDIPKNAMGGINLDELKDLSYRLDINTDSFFRSSKEINSKDSSPSPSFS